LLPGGGNRAGQQRPGPGFGPVAEQSQGAGGIGQRCQGQPGGGDGSGEKELTTGVHHGILKRWRCNRSSSITGPPLPSAVPCERRTVLLTHWSSARKAAAALLACVIVLATLWGAFALWFQLPGPGVVRALVVAGWCLVGGAAVAALWRGTRWRLAAPAHLLALGALLGWWSTLEPSHHREWADDVARLLEADIHGSRVTLRNVRNFDWHTPEDYTVRWETREYDLDRLVSADLILSYWMGPAIAHTLVSFGFDDGEQLVFSLEIRKERHESFSALGGFFRKFEQVLVAADENDIIRTRSNARGEDVYLY